ELWAQQTNIDVNGTDKNITTDGESAQLNDTVVPRVDFPIDEYKRLAKKGRATVRGMIYLDDGYGGKAYGKNTRLYLNPVTSYSKQWYDESYIQGYKLSKADSRLYNYLKFTTSDGSGKFAFFGIPSGNYYVIGSVNHNGKKIRIADEISVKSSGTVQAVLSRSMD
ncbi:MAG: carboxypeptidase regulatory-like domain-containing protein, partial [Campylobacterota bacterium]|nr:carboxypeptidase regulatory-like domain-containing protein [Campylobacterota bacterium]